MDPRADRSRHIETGRAVHRKDLSSTFLRNPATEHFLVEMLKILKDTGDPPIKGLSLFPRKIVVTGLTVVLVLTPKMRNLQTP
jgi:hypothetical protein